MSKLNLFQKVWSAPHSRRVVKWSNSAFCGEAFDTRSYEPASIWYASRKRVAGKVSGRTLATVDHIVPTDEVREPYSDPLADAMIKELRKNCADFGVTFFDVNSGNQGIVHVVGPEQGLTQPGMTIACGDSHTSTHGAFGAVAFGVGTSQVRDLLATQTMALSQLKVRRIEVNGTLGAGVYAKDVILHIIRKLGVNGGTGYAYEYAGEVFDNFSMEEENDCLQYVNRRWSTSWLCQS